MLMLDIVLWVFKLRLNSNLPISAQRRKVASHFALLVRVGVSHHDTKGLAQNWVIFLLLEKIFFRYS